MIERPEKDTMATMDTATTAADAPGSPDDRRESGGEASEAVATAAAATGTVVPWDDLGPKIIEAIQTIYDPEIPVNIYELGLIYSVSPADTDGHVDVKMTLTSPHCPVAESLPGEVQMTVEGVEGVQAAKVDVVWDPPWNPDMMSEAAKLELGMF